MSEKIFHIVTIANKLEQYQEMKESFIKAGFDEVRCRYSLFDNSKGNIYDPYATFNEVKLKNQEPFIIFCHQDVLMNQGDGFEQLVKVLAELEKLNPQWAIAGNAGRDHHHQFIAKITDPLTKSSYKNLPHKVHSLDENFLVIKSSSQVKCSLELSGFHFYGSDLCLQAILSGYSCYVIDFHLTHLSSGKLSQAFWDVKEKFEETWNNQFNFCYIKTTMNILIGLSKYPGVRSILNSDNFRNVAMSKAGIRKIFNPYNVWTHR